VASQKHCKVGHQSGAAFVRPSALTYPPVADQSTCTGVGVGVGVTVADGSGEGDSPAVEKFRPRGVGAGINWRGSIVFAVVGVAAAVPVCVAEFVFAVVFVPVWAFARACVAPVEVPLEPLSPAAAPVIPTAWLRIPVCAPALIPVCAPAFVFGAVIVLLRKFVPGWTALVELPLKPLCPVGAVVGAPGGLLPLVPIRDVCARLNVTVATHITITPSLIELIWVILFSLRPCRPLFGRRIFHSLKYSARADPRYCARGGFFTTTPEVIGAPSFEIGWSGLCLCSLIEFGRRASPIFSKAAAMLAVRFLKGRRPHVPSRLRARQTPG
jgi:hypothetical protein